MSLRRWLEIVTSTLTLAGMALGTNSLIGIGIYLFARLTWWWLIIQWRMWGLAPLNAGMTVVWLWHLYLVGGL